MLYRIYSQVYEKRETSVFVETKHLQITKHLRKNAVFILLSDNILKFYLIWVQRSRYSVIHTCELLASAEARPTPEGDAARFACDILFCTCSSIVICLLNFLKPSRFGLLLSLVFVFFSLIPLLISFNNALCEFGFSDSKMNCPLFFTTADVVMIGLDLKLHSFFGYYFVANNWNLKKAVRKYKLKKFNRYLDREINNIDIKMKIITIVSTNKMQ